MDPNTIATPEPAPTPTSPTVEPKKSNKTVYLVIGVVVLVLVGAVLLLNASSSNQTTPQPSTTTQVDNSIKNDTDLTAVESSLDSANIDGLGLGSELDQNDTDASQF